MSFDRAFAQSYAQATVRKASREQLMMMMLQAEATRVSQHGTIRLEAGGAIASRNNRYYHPIWPSTPGRKWWPSTPAPAGAVIVTTPAWPDHLRSGVPGQSRLW